MVEKRLGHLLHLAENHGAGLFGTEHFCLPMLHPPLRLPFLVHHLVWQELHVPLCLLVVEPSPDEPLDVEDGPLQVEGGLVLGYLPDEALCVCERDLQGGDFVPLVVGDNLDSSVPAHAHIRVCCPEIDSHHRLHPRFLCRRPDQTNYELYERGDTYTYQSMCNT